MANGKVRFYMYNGRGDVVGQTDSSGTPTYQAAYEAFGDQTVQTGSTLDRQKANTKEQDPTGLLNEGFRYRDPSTGTFLTRDPLGFKAGLNMYTYVRQNPWTRFDPLGLQTNTPPQPPPKQNVSSGQHSSTPSPIAPPSSPKPGGTPSLTKSARNTQDKSFTTTNVTTDFDGGAHTYAPPGSGLHGEDHLKYAMNSKGQLSGAVIQMDKNGNPVTNKEGFYVSKTSLTDAHGHPLDADTVPYVALGNKQTFGAQKGDKVTVTSQPLDAHGKPVGSPVTINTVFGDSRGKTKSNNTGAEMSPALEHSLGITTGKYGVVTSNQSVTVTPHPGTGTGTYTGQ
jgi:RHS repeat-associated protein